MNIALIQPSIGKITDEPYTKSWTMQPLGIAVLAGLTPEVHDLRFFDDRFDALPYDEHFDLVALPVETYTAARAYAIASKFRERGVPVVMGGIHASLAEEEVMANADYVVVGPAEGVWPTFLEDVENRKAKKIYRGSFEKTLPHVTPRRQIFGSRPYLPLEMVETGRGCPYHCDFCAIAGSFKSQYASKALDRIVADIGSTKSRFLYFVDDNFVSQPKRTRALCDAIAPLHKKWFSHGSITMTHDDALLKRLAKSGCVNILIGFESLSLSVLERMGKSWNVARRSYHEAIQKLRDHGITVYGTFVFGYDNDESDVFERTLEFAIEQKLALAAFNHLVPFPGTPLFSRLKREGRLLHDKWWLDKDYRFGEVAFQPKRMSPQALAEQCFELRRGFYSFKSITKRLFDVKANARSIIHAAAFLQSNMVSHKGVKERQLWPLGEELSRQDYENKYRINPLSASY